MSSENTKNLRNNSLAKNPWVSGYEIDVTCDSNGLIRIATAQPTRGVVVLESEQPVNVTVAYNRSGYALLRVTTFWEFLEHVSIDETTSSFDFASEVRTPDSLLSISGIWQKPSGVNTALELRLNEANSSGLSDCHCTVATVRTGSNTTGTGLFVAPSAGTLTATHRINATLDLEEKLFRSRTDITRGTTAVTTEGTVVSGKYVSTEEITRIGLRAGSNMAAGSYFELHRRPRLNKTKLKLWVY